VCNNVVMTIEAINAKSLMARRDLRERVL